MSSYDVVIIGGGPGGYSLAERLSEKGKKVAVIEKRALGGVCLNEGCIPTKAFLYCAKQADMIKHSQDYGISVSDVSYNHEFVVSRKNEIVKQLVSGVGAAMKAHGVDVFYETAVIKGGNESGFSVQSGDEQITAQNIVIATGSTVAIPPIEGIEDGISRGFVKTSKEMLDTVNPPKSMVCIGGGIVGLEMACYFATIGAQVTVIEMLPGIAPSMDADIGRTVMRSYKKLGINFLTGGRVCKISDGIVECVDSKGESRQIQCDTVLVSTGRKPCIDVTGLDDIGVKTKNGAIEVDEYMRTNIGGVYAVGDCNGKLMLAHTAYRQAEVAAAHIVGEHDDKMRYDTVASVLYTNPEAACVGLSSEQIKESGLNVKQVKIPMRANGRFLAEGSRDGFCKVIYDIDNDCIVSVSIVGSYASEIIEIAAIMIEQKLPLESLRKFVFPHPTVSEIIKDAIFAI